MTLYTFPEDQLLNVPDEQLEALAAYNLLMLDIQPDISFTDEHIQEQYQKFLKKVSN